MKIIANIVDSHCHLSMLGENVAEYIQNARDNGVNIIQNISVNFAEFENNYQFCEKYENIYCSLGIHPLYVDKHRYEYELAELYVKFAKVNAIGECGLDYSREPDLINRRLQQEIFLKQINLAVRYNLPIIIHTRNAEEHTGQYLKDAFEKRGLKGVMHCFTGSADLAHKMVDCGFYISFSGIITFKKKVEHLWQLIRDLPLSQILVETDAPYLAPEPYRGQANRPEFMIETIKKIAELKNCSYEEVAMKTSENYQKLFLNKQN